MPNIIGFQTQKQLVTLNNIQVLIKCVLIDLRARNSGHRARNSSSPEYCKIKLFSGTILHGVSNKLEVYLGPVTHLCGSIFEKIVNG